MNAEEAKQFLANLAPGEAERILRDNMISPGERYQFQKRQAQILYESLYLTAPHNQFTEPPSPPDHASYATTH